MATRVSALVIGAVLLVLGLAVLVGSGRTDTFDHAVIDIVRAPAYHDGLAFFGTVTHLGSTGAVTVVAAIVAAVGVLIGPWRHGVIGAAVIGLASLGVELLKAVMARARPDILDPLVVEHGFSFPSGHSTLSMTSYGILAVLVMRTRLPAGVRAAIAVALGILVAVIGVSRVWLGVHFPTDVLAGWATGALVVAGYAALTREVSRAPAAAAVDADPGARRSDRPAPG